MILLCYDFTPEEMASLMALKAKCRDLYVHSVQVGHVSVYLCQCLLANGNGFRTEFLGERDTFILGLLHDIGKLHINCSILSKDSGLTERELEVVEQHAELGYGYLRKIRSLRHLAPYVLQHHEPRYPGRIPLSEMHLQSRVLNIADRFSAMLMDKPYRKAYSVKWALRELHPDIEEFFGAQYGGRVVGSLSMLDQGMLMRVEESFTDTTFSAMRYEEVR